RFTDPNNPGRGGDQRSVPAGVWGTATEGFGVAGSSFKASGVLGQSGPAPTFDPKLNYTGGVTGTSRDASGVVAVSQNSLGVVATSQTSAGVSATSQKSAGVSAVSGANSGILAISGSQGPSIPNPNLPSIAGVIGSSDAQPGVIGTSRAQVGVYGFSSAGVGLVGHSTNAASYAGIFFGNFVVVGGTKSAAVQPSACSIASRARRFGSRISAVRSSSAVAPSSISMRISPKRSSAATIACS